MNNNYQQELIGILANKPQYFNSTILTKDFFNEPFDYIFEKLRLSYLKHKDINYMEIIEDKKINDTLFVDCVTNVIHTYEKYFRTLESQAVDEYKKKKIHEWNTKLIRNEIDVNKFTYLVDGLKTLSAVESRKLTSETIEAFKTNKNKLIRFDKYKKLEKYSKIKEHDLVIVGGKTGTGKTGFALNLLNDLSKNYPCLYINIELSEESIVQRLIAMNSQVSMNDLDNCETLHQNKINRINLYSNSLGNDSNIDIVTGSQSINAIKSMIGSYEQDKHYIVFIDHIGRIGSYGKGLYEKMTNTVIQLRNLSLDFNCTIIALCQLSRESSKEKKPSLNLLRDSGEIEQSARKVMFVWEDEKKNYALWICKNDSSPLCKIPVIYNKEIQLFSEIDKVRE